MSIKIIAAIGKNNELGINNNDEFSLLNWKLPGDLKRFKDLTTDHIVLMGRKTWDSLPANFKPLSNRLNIVMTRNKNKDFGENVFLIDSKNELDFILKYEKFQNKDLWIVGGGEIYNIFLDDADELYLTEVDGVFPDANVFFPKFNEKNFELISSENGHKEGGEHSHKFYFKKYKKKK